jgi:hypothetical protein
MTPSDSINRDHSAKRFSCLRRSLQASPLRSIGVLVLVLSLAAPLGLLSPAAGQRRRTSRTRRAPVAKPRVDPNALDKKKLEQVIGLVCAERERDPLGSAPIDEMQSRPSLELNHPEAVIGAQRAQRLLPVAKELVIQALRQLATEYKIPAPGIRAASRRVLAVTDILPDPDLRDNAAVVMSDPHTIRFGTIFLVGLPSDEGMISVLSHELTHIADGRPNSLGPLFQVVGKRASSLTNLRINGQKAEELTCDLVGVRAARRFVAITPDKDTVRQRLARTLEHNCVDDDDTDEEHLSPRSTMRAVLALDPTLTRQILDYEDDVLKDLRFGQLIGQPVAPLTMSTTHFYHHPLR